MSEEKCEKQLVKCGTKFGMRHAQSLLLFYCIVIQMWCKINTSVAIVAMTIPNDAGFKTFDWDADIKSIILSSTSWASIFMQIPFGKLGQLYGTRIILLIAVLIPSILTILTPPLVNFGGWHMFCAIKIIQSLLGGGFLPLVNVHLSKWAPIEERNLLGTISLSGLQFGTVIAFLSSGLIASGPLGWPGIFYIPGFFGLIWSILWIFLGANSPQDCKKISLKEKDLIEFSLIGQKTHDKIPTPWKNILTSLPFWALVCVRSSHGWGEATLLIEMPMYMNGVLKLDLKKNAIFTALPYVLMFSLVFVFLFLAHVIQKRTNASLTVIRKTCSTISQWVPTCALIGLAFVTEDNVALAVILLAISVGLNSGATLGSAMNSLDLAPNHAGILMGITGVFKNIIGIAMPLIAGKIITNEFDQSQWQILFFITAGIYFGGNLIYIIFGKMEKQPWNEPNFLPKKPLLGICDN